MRNLVRAVVFVWLACAAAQAQTKPPGQVTPPIAHPPLFPLETPPPQRGVPLPEPKPLVPATPREEPDPGGPRIPADFMARAMLANDPEFVGRVTTATLVVADDVLTETATRAAPTDPRLALVGTVMRDPEQAGRKMARLVAANVPATMLVGGSRPQTPLTDDELVAFIAARWTALASAGTF